MNGHGGPYSSSYNEDVNSDNHLPRPRSSLALNKNDSMATHLLVEQAIYDSVNYEILSYDDVEDLKKEYMALTNRIDASTRKLAMESKVRDAELSLSRLSSRKGRRSGGGAATALKQPGEELSASAHKCEELTQELNKLNHRSMEIQKRLLQHSAGILGMTHTSISAGDGLNGTGSPANEYTFVPGKAGADPQAFDDRSFYRTADKLDGFGETPRGSAANGGAKKAVVDDSLTADRLDALNQQLNTILRSGSRNVAPPPQFPEQGQGVNQQLALLDQNIQYLRQYPPAASRSPGLGDDPTETLERTETILMTLWDMIITFDEEVREQKMDRRQNGYDNTDYPESDFDSSEPPEYTISTFSSKVQSMLNKVVNLRNERDMLRERSGQEERDVEEDMKIMQEDMESIQGQVGQLSNLLEQRENDLLAANEKIHAQIGELRGLQTAMNHNSEQLSRAKAELSQKEEELGELHAALDQKNAELISVTSQLDVESSKNDRRPMDVNEEEVRIGLEQQLEDLYKKLAEQEETLVALEIKFQETKEDRDATKTELNAVVDESEARLKHLEGEISTLKEARKISDDARNLSAANETSLRQELDEKEKEIKKMEEELQEFTAKVAKLSTEVVMARAELDTAYGSKSERAAATAEARAAAQALERANKQPQTIDSGLLTEIEELEKKNAELIDEIVKLKNERAEGANNEHLQKRCKLLQKELDDMLIDFENLTKQSIKAEQERSKLEATVDSLKEKIEASETALAEERIRHLGTPRPGGPGGRDGETTTTSVLKQEFKKMMRDMRAEQARALRAEQDERRKLEGMIRSMKKEQLARRMTPLVDAT